MKYQESIITKTKDRCYLCGSRERIEIHHIFSGSNRQKSTAFGCVVSLCYNCHQGTNGVHHNREKMDHLRKIAQLRCEEVYNWTEKDFLSVFHRNYLTDEDREQLKAETINLEDDDNGL